MRSCLVCVAALGSAPAVALELRGANAPAAYTLSCDDVNGCHYNLPPTEAPLKLICDDMNGCRYTGVTPPPTPKPLFPPPDPAMLKKVFEDVLSHVDLSKIPEELAKLKDNMSKLPAELAKLKLPDVSKLPEQLANLKPPDLSKLPEQLAKMMPPDLAKALGKMPSPPPSATPAQPALAAQTAPAKQSTAVASFVPDNGMCCVQGAPDYIKEALAKLKVSPIGEGYISATVENSSCADRGYANGPKPEACFPQSQLYLSKDHAINPLSEPMLMANYASKHGIPAVAEGMAALCKK